MAAKRKTAPDAGKTGRGRGFLRLAGWLLLLAVPAVVLMFGLEQVDRSPLAPRVGPAIGDARSWGYQLQSVNLKSIAAGIDVLVVDYSRDGSERRVLRPVEIDTLRIRADGSKRIVLAYMSIGEAENYRYYWRRDWEPGKPTWLGPENREWRGNFPVRYWEPGWRRIIMQPRTSLFGRVLETVQPARRAYLDRIIEAGFDGVYLDRIDAFETWAGERPTAQADMVEFVRALSIYAKQRQPGFLVVPQNGEELLRFADYRGAIDAIAKEDLVFGIKGDGRPNTAEEIASGIRELGRLKAERRPVFVVEYLTDPVKRADVQRRLGPLGFVVQFASRDLRHIPETAAP
jgi:cysteinyl-tRNA synthetase, unknown class